MNHQEAHRGLRDQLYALIRRLDLILMLTVRMEGKIMTSTLVYLKVIPSTHIPSSHEIMLF